MNNKLCPHLYVYIQLQKPSHNCLGHIAMDIFVHIYVCHNRCLVLILLIRCGYMFVGLCALCQEELNEEKVDRNLSFPVQA